MAKSKVPLRRAFSLSLPFNWFLFNDEEDFHAYMTWEAERQDWWSEFDSLPHHINFEAQTGRYDIYTGDVDQWFKEELVYDNEAGRYKDGEREFVIFFTVYVVESVLGKTVFECKNCKGHFTKDSLCNNGYCVLCGLQSMTKESE